MKSAFTIFIFLGAFLSVKAQRLSTDSLKKVIVFRETYWNFGEVREGDTVFHEFTFTNKGEDSLEIQEVIRGCGCILPLWTKRMISQGDTGNVKIGFISKGQSGDFVKGFSLYTTRGYFPLTVSGRVISRKEE